MEWEKTQCSKERTAFRFSSHLCGCNCAKHSGSVEWWAFEREQRWERLRRCTETPSEPELELCATEKTRVRFPSFIHPCYISETSADRNLITFRNGAAVMARGECSFVFCWICGPHLTAGGRLAFRSPLEFNLSSPNGISRKKINMKIWLRAFLNGGPEESLM